MSTAPPSPSDSPTPPPAQPPHPQALRPPVWRRVQTLFQGTSQTVKVAIVGGFFTLASAVVAGVCAIVVALIPAIWNENKDDGHSGSSASTPPAVSTTHPEQSSAASSASQSSQEPKVSITSWTETSSTSSTKTYVFSGSVTALTTLAEIHIIVQPSKASSSASTSTEPGAKWLVSPEAKILKGNRWRVTWTLNQPPTSGRWVAVIIEVPQTAPSGVPTCSPGPPGCTLTQHLEWEGPDAQGVLATVTAARGINRTRPSR